MAGRGGASRRRARQAGRGWAYVAGGVMALGLAIAVILLGVATRAGQEDGTASGPLVVPTPRPADVPRDGMTYGRADAPVVISEYLDFQCPFCRRAAVSVLPVIEAEYVATGKVRIEVHPIAILGDESGLAAQAARCAGEQGKFWEYHDILFANQSGENVGAFTEERLRQMATALQLDVRAFGSCLGSDKYAGAVEQETQAAHNAGVKGTPTFLVNGKRVEPALDALKSAIEAALAGG